ncbi:MAG TPA: hypothetical protein PLT76_08030 [Candidatus Omnitrophota bacterium]|nr:hypothetical protein [Candidatus Omnitrophota bacterium]HQO58652.1 hypothetical protein [Candidatus Omnitrophota bacterium]
MLYIILISCAVVFISGCGDTPVKPVNAPPDEKTAASTLAPAPEEDAQVSGLSYDNKTGTLVYTLSGPALVRVRFGQDNNGPLLINLIDWEEQDEGGHKVVWDKKDESKRVDFSSRRGLMASVFTLPWDPQKRAAYTGAVRGLRKAPGIHLLFPASSNNSINEVPIVNGLVPVRVIVDGKDKKWLTDVKYGVSFFLDSAHLLTDQEGISPYTYFLDTQRLRNGQHIVTVNITAYSGEIATASRMIKVNNTQLKGSAHE